jgi:signal transduction histidine kinase
MADPNQLDQVLVNLSLNARDAMPEGGRLTIEAHEAELDETFAAGHLGARPGPHVVLTVADTGAGMSEHVRNHAFEPFFTTKGPGKGTGLGLATVLGIVEQSNGYLDVDSEPGNGTRFHIYMPKVAPPTAQRTDEEPAPSVGPGTGTLLVVEDEPALVSQRLS